MYKIHQFATRQLQHFSHAGVDAFAIRRKVLQKCAIVYNQRRCYLVKNVSKDLGIPEPFGASTSSEHLSIRFEF